MGTRYYRQRFKLIQHWWFCRPRQKVISYPVIDFNKAFGYVDHEKLWHKLFKLGLNDQIINISNSKYQGIRKKMLRNHAMPESFPYRLGVRQGECFSTLLFATYIKKIQSHFIYMRVAVLLSAIWNWYCSDTSMTLLYLLIPEALQMQIAMFYSYYQNGNC